MQKKRQLPILEIILSLIAIFVTVSMFLKAIIDIDPNYDVGWYQLPFSARIWGIVTEKEFLTEKSIEYRYLGFPLLANFFQGLFWKITGRVQSANLVGYSSLILYFLFLKSYFKVPLYLSAIAIFTIPAVITHSYTGFVDLPGNIGVSVVMMMTYRLFSQSRLPKRGELLAIFLGAAAAANIKPQLQVLIFIIYWILGARLIWLYFKHTNGAQRRLWLTMPLAVVASTLIFATPIKNLAFYGNPFYPIKVEVAGITLNHKLDVKAYEEGNRPQKWLQSVFEINTPRWSADQWNQGDDRYMDRGGGFFGAYVVFNLVLLIVLTTNEQLRNWSSPIREKFGNSTVALITVILMSLIPANFPQSHELRYFMFWMITLVSLNLYLFTTLSDRGLKLLQPKYLGLACLLFFTIFSIKVKPLLFFKPAFLSLEKFMASNGNVKPELLRQLTPNERTCMISRAGVINAEEVPVAQINTAFYYSSYFHPEIKYPYSIQAMINPKGCGDLKIIPANAQEFIDGKISK